MDINLDHKFFFERAFQLAYQGRGNVVPNPAVGAVIVKDGQIIGEGFHEVYGGPHAEVNALSTLENKLDLKGAIFYVTLEPCAHEGKTPSCARTLAKLPIKQVYFCEYDPNPLVNGQGQKIIKSAGIPCEYIQGFEEHSFELNPDFLTIMSQDRPFISAKLARTNNDV